MNPEQARDVLHARLSDRTWYRQTIVGQQENLPVLYVMVAASTDRSRSEIPFTYGGYPVCVRVDQPMRFAGQYSL